MKWLCTLLLLLPLVLLAQSKKDTSYVYLTQDLSFTKAKNAAFVGVSVKVQGGWMVYALYPDTTPLLKAFYRDRQLKVKQGPYTLFYPKNVKAREGYYSNNQMVGVWRFWHPNGQLKDSGMIQNNNLSGLWKSWHPNGQLMSVTHYKQELPQEQKEALQVLEMLYVFANKTANRHGPFSSWYSNGQPEATGQFANGKMDSTWVWYHPNGAKATEEVYKAGLITSLQCFDSTGRSMGDMCSIDKPALLKDYGNYKNYVYENLVWPEEAQRKGIEGNVLVQFTVGADGTLKSVTATSAQPVLQKAVEDFFWQLKEWEPAISHNRTIDVTYEMTIPFRLNEW